MSRGVTENNCGLFLIGRELNSRLGKWMLSGLRPFEIMKLLPLSYREMDFHRKRLGLPAFKRGRKRSIQAFIDTARKLKVEGLTYREIGQRMGVSYQRVQQYLADGVPSAKGKPCEICGSVQMVARHHVDYATNEIQYLCASCHTKQHAIWAERTFKKTEQLDRLKRSLAGLKFVSVKNASAISGLPKWFCHRHMQKFVITSRSKKHSWHLVDFGMSNREIERRHGIPSRLVSCFRYRHKIGNSKTFRQKQQPSS